MNTISFGTSPSGHLTLGDRVTQVTADTGSTVYIYIQYVTQKTNLFPRTRRVGFPKVAARQYADARVAICGSSARQCADAPRISKKFSDECASLRTRSKTGIGC